MTLKQLYEVASKFESDVCEHGFSYFEIELNHTFGDLAKFKLQSHEYNPNYNLFYY